jgi:hypothetical protein
MAEPWVKPDEGSRIKPCHDIDIIRAQFNSKPTHQQQALEQST